MLFSNVFSLTTVTVLIGAALARAQLADGRYRIWNGLQSARSFPGGAQQGPFQSFILMSDQFASIYEQWDVSSDGNGGYIIQNVGTGAKAFADPTSGAQVVAASNQQSSWSIVNNGNNGQDDLYVIKVPSQDLLWTNTPRDSLDNAIFLKGSDGSAAQSVVFQAI